MLPFTLKLIYDGAHVQHGRGVCTLSRLSACLLAIAFINVGGAVLVATPAYALAPQPAQFVSHKAGQAAPAFSLEKAVAKVRREVAGRILSARTVRDEQDNGRITHRIKVLTPQGRVIVIRIDAQSGKRLP